MDQNVLLISNGFVPIPPLKGGMIDLDKQIAALGTIFANFAHYGFVPSIAVVRALKERTPAELGSFWKSILPAIRKVTGANREMANFVVYKNFPRETLEMSKAQYWVAQILMYWGLPNDLFTQEEEPRAELREMHPLKVLDRAGGNTMAVIYKNLVGLPARWTDSQKEHAEFLFAHLGVDSVDASLFGFKENAILVAKLAVAADREVVIATATDVLRLAAALSDGDIALREKVKFKRFTRPERRFLVALLEKCNLNGGLAQDFGLRPEIWKRLLSQLHPGDYKCPRVKDAYDSLYTRTIPMYNSFVERWIADKNPIVFQHLATRPGDFSRRFHKLYSVFGARAVKELIAVLPKLTTMKLLKLDRYLDTIGNRMQLIYPPKGNWTRAQIALNKKTPIASRDLRNLGSAISTEIRSRLKAKFPEGFDVDFAVEKIRLQTNDQKLAPYGRGTEFPIPETVTFIRSASFWQIPTAGLNIWFDNGWNFFGEGWKPMGACCWTDTNEFDGGAVFSGDPTNAKDLKGRACQMIDLYPEQLRAAGVRYAVWNVLAYSRVCFDKADDVLATLQWGEEPQSGNLYEPARAQMVFPLKGANLTKYVAYIDLKRNVLVYVDANLKGGVRSAAENSKTLAERFPAFLEYLYSLPTVGDLFLHADRGTIPVLYSDEGVSINGPAYVFQRKNAANRIKPIDLTDLIGD